MFKAIIRSNIGEVKAMINRLPDRVRGAAEDTSKFLAKEAWKQARLLAPVDTGFFHADIDWWRARGSGNEIVYVVGVRGLAEEYAGAVEFGFKSHIIPLEYITNAYRPKGTYIDNYDGPYVRVEKAIKPGGYVFGPAILNTMRNFSPIVNAAIKKNIKLE